MTLVLILLFSLAVHSFAVEQEQPTPYDLIRPVWPMTWDTASADNGGTVESFSQFVPNKAKLKPIPAVGSVPADFKPNAIVPDTLNQAFLDARNMRIGRIRVNQAGYLTDDSEKQFYYVSGGSCKETFSVVDLEGTELAKGGTFTSTGKETQSSWTIVAGTDAATNEKERYKVSTSGPTGTVCVGNLTQLTGLPENERMRIKVLNQYSSTFIISDRVYSMVRDATIKFYGINRSGNSESWFHKASHAKDGSASYVAGTSTISDASLKTPTTGALQGGWYDCGDHLKESQTQAYAFMVLAVMAASNPDRDDDNYAYNHASTVTTDGVPDILREAKHGADFFLRSYVFANGIIDNMVVSIGNFGADHGWWGRPENQDALPATLKGRGGPHERDLRLGELGSNISGQIAAGLAILSKDYAVYDKAFADSCLLVAEKMYEFAKNLKLKEKSLGPGTYDGGKNYVYNKVADGWSSPAYNGNNESHDDLGIAAIALHYATYEKTKKMDYLNEAVEADSIGAPQEASIGFFNGGWFAWNRDGMRKSSKNTSWANAYTYTLYGFYKMLLKDQATGLKYGIDNKTRLKYAENVALILATNLSYLSGSGSNSIIIPTLNGSTAVSFGDLWYNMQTDQTWIYNRYRAGNIFEVLAYADVTKDLEGIVLPQKGAQNWNSLAMKQLGINQLNYMLGVNPWDVSFILGIGDKNDAHPHHRAANPEGKNMPGAGYVYKPPTGALFGGVTPNDINDWNPSTLSWEDYHLSETCIDATAMFIASCNVAVKEEDRNRAPKQIDVEIRYVGYDSAIVKIAQDIRGVAMILYSKNETGPFNLYVKDTVPSMTHEIHMTGLENGTAYYFKVVAINSRSEAYATRWLIDSTSTPFSFTTLVSPQGPADIQNVKICNVSADSAEVMWFTPNGQYESKVYWDTLLTSYDQMMCPTTANGNCDIQGNADVSGIPTNFHYVKIGNLKELTTYYYCVESNGTVKCTDNNNQPLKFTTPVTRYNFDVVAYQYEFTGLDFLNVNIINNEERAFDSLTLRLYVTARPDEIEPILGVNNQPGSCPLLIDEDICQAYDEAGFNKPCIGSNGENADNLIRNNLRHSTPVRLDDTYDAATGTYGYYLPIDLGATEIKSSSRMRIDFGFSSGLYQNGGCETLRQVAKKRMSNTSGDWSWAPHTREKDGADYDGMPLLDKDFGDKAQSTINPFIVVYRKDQFISGFSPSYQEMTTKIADYKLTVAYDAPFNVEGGSYIQIDSAKSTMYITGTALISESGYVTSIWVNGVALTNEQLAKAAIYNESTGKYDLNIPVKLSIGTNKVDVTVFAGPDPSCTECQETGGCAFVNRNYFIQFSKGDRTAGMLQLVKKDGNSVSSPIQDDPMEFKILVNDKDNAKKESIKVSLYNSRTKDSTYITLKRTDAVLGHFESDYLSAVTKEGASAPNISMLSGDTIYVTYSDEDDEDDVVSQYFYSNPTTPIPQKALLVDSDCNLPADFLNVTFSGNTFDGANLTLDSLYVEMGAIDSITASYWIKPQNSIIGSEASIALAKSIKTSANPVGNVTIYMTEAGAIKTANVSLSDGIAPTLASVAILENENHESENDTLRVIFSEPVVLQSQKKLPLRITNGTSEIDLSSITVVNVKSLNNNKSFEYVIKGNTNGDFIKKGYKAEIAADFKISDMSGNALSDCNGPVTIVESVRPVPVKYAYIKDVTGDGEPDSVVIQFASVLREKDMLDTIDVYWGSPEIYKAFAKPAKGWALDTILGEKSATWITTVDSSNGTWSVKSTKTCATKTIKDTTWIVIEKENSPGVTYIDSTVGSITDKMVEDKTNCTVAYDSVFVPKTEQVLGDSVQSEHSVISIAIESGTFTNKTHGSRNGKGLVLPRQGAIGGFFDENTAPLNDLCPPVIVSAFWVGMETRNGAMLDKLTLTMSEPLDTLENRPYYIERRRNGTSKVYLERAGLRSVSYSSNTTSYSYTYDDDENTNVTIHVGDSVRLVPTTFSFYQDKAGLIAGEETPWVPVTGVVNNVRIKFSMDNYLTTSNEDNVYKGEQPDESQHFRLSLINANGENQIIAKGNNELKPVKMEPIAAYKFIGPVFTIDLTMPQVKDSTEQGEAKRLYQVKLDVDFFNNLGSYVNGTYYEFDMNELLQYVDAGSNLRLYLEWCIPEEAPLSAENRKINTGAYISKYNIRVKGLYIAKNPDESDTKEVNSRTKTGAKTFGFRRAF